MSSTETTIPEKLLVPPPEWGCRPTPILPRCYVNAVRNVALPAGLRDGLATSADDERLRVVGDIAGYWASSRQRVPKPVLRKLATWISGEFQPPQDLVVLPAHAQVTRLLECSLSTRPFNCIIRGLREARLQRGRAITVGDLLSLRSFGLRSLLETMCVLEAALDSGYLFDESPPPGVDHFATVPTNGHNGSSMSGSNGRHSAFSFSHNGSPSSRNAQASAIDSRRILESWGQIIPQIERLLTAARDVHGVETLGDSLSVDLSSLVTQFDLKNQFQDITLEDVIGDRTLAGDLLSSVFMLWQSCSESKRLILTDRLYASNPKSCREIGEVVGVTGEMIRRHALNTMKAINDPQEFGDLKFSLRAVAAMIRRRLAPVTRQSEFEKLIATSVCSKDLPPGADTEVVTLARLMVSRELDYKLAHGYYFSEQADALCYELLDFARENADDVGMFEEAKIQALLPDAGWRRHWNVLLKRVSLYPIAYGFVGLRDTNKARVKAAILAAGAPTTKQNIASLSGLPVGTVGSTLSAIKSIVRADKYRWAISDWVGDSYDGICEEIRQRIDEDGGKTRLDRLLDEIPRLFGVKATSVRAYAETDQFSIDDGWVSLSYPGELDLAPFSDVAVGRDSSGDPYWQFEMDSRYKRGYSIVSVPKELVAELDCPMGGNTLVPVRSPSDVRDVSVIWRMTSLNGPEIGRVSNALAAIEAEHGDSVRLVLHDDRSVSFVQAG